MREHQLVLDNLDNFQIPPPFPRTSPLLELLLPPQTVPPPAYDSQRLGELLNLARQPLVLANVHVHPGHPRRVLDVGIVVWEVDPPNLKVPERCGLGVLREVDGALELEDGEAGWGL